MQDVERDDVSSAVLASRGQLARLTPCPEDAAAFTPIPTRINLKKSSDQDESPSGRSPSPKEASGNGLRFFARNPQRGILKPPRMPPSPSPSASSKCSSRNGLHNNLAAFTRQTRSRVRAASEQFHPTDEAEEEFNLRNHNYNFATPAVGSRDAASGSGSAPNFAANGFVRHKAKAVPKKVPAKKHHRRGRVPSAEQIALMVAGRRRALERRKGKLARDGVIFQQTRKRQVPKPPRESCETDSSGEPPKKKRLLTFEERGRLIREGKRKAKERRALMRAQMLSQREDTLEKCDTPLTNSASYLDIRPSRTASRGHEPITEKKWNENRRLLDPRELTMHKSSSSRSIPFPFKLPPVLNQEFKPKGVQSLDEQEFKLIGRRKPGNQRLPDLLYDVTEVVPASKDSLLFRTTCRETWKSIVPEMSMLSAEAGFRNRHKLAKNDLHTYDSKPLRMDYIYDRVSCDDPVHGWQIRCRHTGHLQGFITYTKFMTYQPMIFHDGPPDLVRSLNRCHRENSYWFGSAWTEIVELVLLGALGCGTVLMEEFIKSLINTNVKYVIIHATVHAQKYYEKLGFQRVKASARYDVKNKQLRMPTVTSAGYDGGYGFHMLLLQFTNDLLASVPMNPMLREIASRVDRGFLTSLYQAWKAFEPHIGHGSKMESRRRYDFYRTQYAVHEEFQIDVTSPKYVSAFLKDPAVNPYHHWQFKSVKSSELEDPSLLLVLDLSDWSSWNPTPTISAPVEDWTCPPLYEWVRPQQQAKFSPQTITYIPGRARGVMSQFTYWYISELIPDLGWAHLIPLVEKGKFPAESARKGRTRYCLQSRTERGRDLSISIARLVSVPAECIKRSNDPDQDVWDIKTFNPNAYESTN